MYWINQGNNNGGIAVSTGQFATGTGVWTAPIAGYYYISSFARIEIGDSQIVLRRGQTTVEASYGGDLLSTIASRYSSKINRTVKTFEQRTIVLQVEQLVEQFRTIL